MKDSTIIATSIIAGIVIIAVAGILDYHYTNIIFAPKLGAPVKDKSKITSSPVNFSTAQLRSLQYGSSVPVSGKPN